MKKEEVIQNDYIDEENARKFLNTDYNGIDLLPKIPANLDEQTAALALGVSVPTIQRMLQENEIKLTKQSVLAYIFAHFLYQKPVDLTPISQGKIP